MLLGGCQLFPQLVHEPTIHNPFPQLMRVAVAPFFNLSTEPTVDGRKFALAYFNELQLVQGFEVVPVGVVERAMGDYGISLSGPREARRLAQLLGVDAVVVGAVTDFSPYYPPRCALQVEWYAANPGFHSIPPGYGLPWGTPGEEGIPPNLVLEAELALAREQLKTQTPAYTPEPPGPIFVPTPPGTPGAPGTSGAPGMPGAPGPPDPSSPSAVRSMAGGVRQASHQEPGGAGGAAGAGGTTGQVALSGTVGARPPAGWPDPRGFIPPPPSGRRPACCPSDEPVLRHTQTYNGHDSHFTEALSGYYFFRDDARFVGWQAYLQRSDDFIRFCCHMHIWEMLTARGGAGESRVVWRWPTIR
jgi:hypothetical protein